MLIEKLSSQISDAHRSMSLKSLPSCLNARHTEIRHELLYRRIWSISVAEPWRWEMRFIDCLLTPKPRYSTALWRHSSAMKCDFMMLAEPALFDDFNPFCAVSAKTGHWEMMRCLSQLRAGVTVMLHGCQDGYSTTSPRLVGIQRLPQGYCSNADTCHNSDASKLKGCLLTAAI